jgi:hypothetical protein
MRVLVRTPLAATLAIALSACGASAESSRTIAARSWAAPIEATLATASTLAPGTPACATAAPEVLATTAGGLAKRIYTGELRGSETLSDRHQVESYTPLLNAVASGDRAAINAAVHHLVYSHTHIVRLRVSRGTTVLSDDGGPYILAPVRGTLRLHGRAIAHYVLSVQDDLGYVKLVTRFLDVPLLMRAGSHGIPIEGLLSPGPSSIPDHGPLTYKHKLYEAFSFDARSFPGGPLRISLLLPIPGSLAAKSCAEIKSAELGRAALLISRRFSLTPAAFPVYAKLTRTLTDSPIFIRAGSHQLPDSGPLSYEGKEYEVSSFLAPSSIGHVRVYVLARA